MNFLSISDPQVWLLAGVSILVVFVILTILVLILNIFSAVAKSGSKPKDTKAAPLAAKPAAGASQKSEADQAAVAMALALYLQEQEHSESHILTITPTPNSAWGSVLNPRL